MKNLITTPYVIPDYDTHFETLGQKNFKPCNLNTYQHDRVDQALIFCKHKKLALDVGAHIGLITTKLAQEFLNVLAFEPDPKNFLCLQENTKTLTNVQLHNVAISYDNRQINLINTTSSSGEFRTTHSGNCSISAISIDSLDLPHCDLIKLDVQGYEFFVLRGARKTIRKFKPVIIMEEEADKPDVRKFLKEEHHITPYQARNYLTNNFNYSVAKKINHDLILIP